MKKFIVPFLLVALFSQSSYAATKSFTTLVQSYQYAVLVEWDQADPKFLQDAEDEFRQGVVQLLSEGASPQELLGESLSLIPNATLRQELGQGVELYQGGDFNPKELLDFTTDHISQMEAQGSSWSPAVKIAAGIVGGYVVFKLLMLTILYWDYDPNYGQTGEPPKVP